MFLTDTQLRQLDAQTVAECYSGSASDVRRGDGTFAPVTAADYGAAEVPSVLHSTVALAAPAVSGTTQSVTITLKDGNGDAIAKVCAIDIFWTTSSTGASLSTTPGDATAITVSVGAKMFGDALLAAGTLGYGRALTSAAGLLTFEIDNDGASAEFTKRLALVCADGLVVSAAMAVPEAAA